MTVFTAAFSAVAFYEGRLWGAGKGNFFGSISDAFDGFDEDFEGDAQPGMTIAEPRPGGRVLPGPSVRLW